MDKEEHECEWRDRYFASRQEMIDLAQQLSEDDLHLITSLISIITRGGDEDSLYEMNALLAKHGRGGFRSLK